MSNIDVRIENINQSIAALKGLLQVLSSHRQSPPSASGGGSVVNKIDEIAHCYLLINDDLSQMISGTIQYLQNAKESMESVDHAISNALRK